MNSDLNDRVLEEVRKMGFASDFDPHKKQLQNYPRLSYAAREQILN